MRLIRIIVRLPQGAKISARNALFARNENTQNWFTV